MKRFEVRVTREGRWWMVHIPDLDGLTQARRLAEAPEMAREWIALHEDLALSDVEVNVTAVDAAGLDLAATGDLVAELRGNILQLEAMVSQLTNETARRLNDEGVPMRDIAEVLRVSHQRVGQMVNEESVNREPDFVFDNEVVLQCKAWLSSFYSERPSGDRWARARDHLFVDPDNLRANNWLLMLTKRAEDDHVASDHRR